MKYARRIIRTRKNGTIVTADVWHEARNCPVFPKKVDVKEADRRPSGEACRFCLVLRARGTGVPIT